MNNDQLVIGVTGHRPSKLAKQNCYSDETLKKLTRLAYQNLKKLRPNKVITGMALGWDTGAAIAALLLKIPVVAAVPFQGQESRWPPAAQRRYRRLLEKIENSGGEIVIVSEGQYSPKKMLLRDEYIVDNCDILVALWDGKKSGCTHHTVSYAQQQNVEIVNLWKSWKKL